MRAGLLTDKLEIWQPSSVTDDFGAENTTWEYLTTIKASVTYQSGDKITDNDEILTTYSLTADIRKYHALNETMRVVFNGRKFIISAIIPDKDKKTLYLDLLND